MMAKPPPIPGTYRGREGNVLEAPPRKPPALPLASAGVLTVQAQRRVRTPAPDYAHPVSITPVSIDQGTSRPPENDWTPIEPAVSRAHISYQTAEDIRRDMSANDRAMGEWARTNTSVQIAECQARRQSSTMLWVALGVAILAAVGSSTAAIGVAVVDNAGEKVTARALNETAKATAGLQSEIAQLRREVRDMRVEQREDRADMLARIAARPLQRTIDRVASRPAPRPQPVDRDLEEPKDYGIIP